MKLWKPIAILILALTKFWIGIDSAQAVDFGEFDRHGQWKSVVALVHGDQQGNFQVFCSGVLIDPRVVLTASHCLQEKGRRPSREELQAKLRSMRVYLGAGEAEGKVPRGATLREIRRAELHPQYLRGVRGQNDIALLILKVPAPVRAEDIPPLALDIAMIKQRMRKSEHLTIVGFGYSEQRVVGEEGRVQVREHFGLKHSGRVKVEGKFSDEVQTVPGPQVDENGMYRPTPREGDSGGPGFFHDEDGRVYTAAIVSRATRHNHGVFGTAMGLVRDSVCWIESQTGLNLRVGHEGPDYCRQEAPRRFSSEEVKQFKFLDMCLNEDRIPISAAYTIDVLKRLFNERDCRSLENVLRSKISLNLDATHIKDLSPLADVIELSRLSIRDNGILSVAPLEGLHRLSFLDISYNNIRDQESLAHLEARGLWLVGHGRQSWNIGRTQFIRWCGGHDLPPSAEKTILALLDQFGLRASECVNGNYALIRLRQLRFQRARGLTDMRPLVGLSTLEELDLRGQSINDLQFLEEISDLRVLRLDGNPIRDLRPILKHPSLQRLSIQNMELRDISLLKELRRLQILEVAGNSIRDFSAFADRDGRTLDLRGKDQQK